MKKLLVVEQDDERRRQYREAFERAEYEVTEAHSATEAIEFCKQVQPDLVVIDPDLGRYLGITKGRWVAEETHRCCSAPVIVVAEDASLPEIALFRPDAVVSRSSGPAGLVRAAADLVYA